MDHEGRIEKLQQRLRDGSADVEALLVSDLSNVFYLTGFSGSNGQVLVTRSGAIFFTDPRYEARAGDLVSGAEVVLYRDKLLDRLPDTLRLAGVERLGIEAQTMTVADRDRIAGGLEGVTLRATTGVVEDLRRSKETAEVELIRQAARLADDAFDWVLDRLAAGATEREIALDLEVYLRRHGADGMSFEPIVGSGPLSAHIHHTPTDRRFARGDVILLDFGARVAGYCSDMTRTVVLGEPAEEIEGMYETVLAAQAAGIEALGPGVSGVDADAAARDVIAGAGMGDLFAHGLGHGVGIEVHEAPRLARTSEDTLRRGEVVTVEPGVYRREVGGVRIEDCVLITGSGPEVLGDAPKDKLIQL